MCGPLNTTPEAPLDRMLDCKIMYKLANLYSTNHTGGPNFAD